MSANRKLILFDFDGTLTQKDTLIEFLRFYCGSSSLYFHLLKMLPQLIGMKLGVADPDLVKKNFYLQCSETNIKTF